MPLLVDAYNVLHLTGVLPPGMAGMDEAGLARLIARPGGRWARDSVRLVCDGGPRGVFEGSRHVEGVQIIYAAGVGRAGDADSVLESLIERDSAPRRLTVVSSDRRVVRAAKRRRAAVIPSDRFLKSLLADARVGRAPAPDPASSAERESVPLPRPRVIDWMREFGYDADALQRLAGSSAVPRIEPPRARIESPAPAPPRAAPAPVALPPVDRALADALAAWDRRAEIDELDPARWAPGVTPLRRDRDA